MFHGPGRRAAVKISFDPRSCKGETQQCLGSSMLSNHVKRMRGAYVFCIEPATSKPDHSFRKEVMDRGWTIELY